MSAVVFTSPEGNVSLEKDGNFMARRKGVKRGPKGEWPSGSRTRRSTLASCIEWFRTPVAPTAERVFELTAGRDDQFDRGQSAGTSRSGSVVNGSHPSTYDRMKTHLPGDEIVTATDPAWKLAKDIAKVNFRGFGRVIADGSLGETVKQWIIDHNFGDVPVIRVEEA